MIFVKKFHKLSDNVKLVNYKHRVCEENKESKINVIYEVIYDEENRKYMEKKKKQIKR